MTYTTRTTVKKSDSELAVITRARDICSYIMQITAKSPSRFRYSLVAKLHGYAAGTVTAEEIDQSLAAITGHLDHGNTHRLKQEILRRFVLRKNQ